MENEKKIEFRYYEAPQGFPVIALMGEKWEIPYGNDPLHFHNYLEIGVCRYGEGTMHLGKKEIPYRDGTITVIPKDFLHRTTGIDNNIQKWEYLFVNSESFIRQIYAENLHLASVLQKRLQSRMFLIQSEENPTLASLLNVIFNKMEKRGEFYKEEIKGMLYAVLLEILEINAQADTQIQQGMKQTNFENIVEVLHFVEQNYSQELRISQLAKAGNMSETHFRRIFEEYMNVSPAEYINFVRIEKACELMRKSYVRIHDVGFKVGFPVETTFLRNFKKITGETPQNWKKRLKEEENFLIDYKVPVLKGW